MLSSLRILHPPSSDNPTDLPVLVLRVDNRQYLFNAPEGLSRVLIQRGSRGATRNLQSVFVPRVSSDACGGLPGFIMCMADQTRNSLQLCGPPVMAQLLATARVYTHRSEFPLRVKEVDLESTFDGTDPGPSSSKGKKEIQSAARPGEIVAQDDGVTIIAIPLLPQEYGLPAPQHHRPSSAPAANRSDKPQSKKQKKSEESRKNRFGASAEVQKHLSTMFSSASAEGPPPKAETAAESDEDATTPKRSSPNQMMQTPALAPVSLEEPDAADGQAPVLLYLIKNGAKRGKMDAEVARQQGLVQQERMKELASGQDVEVMRPKGFSGWEEEERKAWVSHAMRAYRGTNRPPQNQKKKKAPVEAKDAEPPSKYDGIEMEAHTIRSSDVLAPPIPGTTVAQIYLPSTAYLTSFLHDSVQSYFDELDEEPHVLVHAVHASVLQDSRYQAFIKRFPKTHHIITTRSFVPDLLAYTSSAMTLLRMSHLDKALFSVPQYRLTPQRKLEGVLGSEYDSTRVQVASPDVTVGLHPRQAPTATPVELEFDFQSPVDSPEAAEAASYRRPTAATLHNTAQNQQRWAKYLELVSQLQEEESQREASSMMVDAPARAKDIQITTLGTGSSLPSKYRNVSATLLHLPNDGGYVLLDAGESTYGQLCRKFGDDADRVLGQIRMIFLSHTHGDHHMGMTALLSRRKQLRGLDGPLFVLSNHYTRNYLMEVNDIQPLDICAPEETATADKGVIMLDNEHFHYHYGVEADPDAAPQPETNAARDVDLPDTQEGRWTQCIRDELRRAKQRRDGAPPSAEEIAYIATGMQVARRVLRKAAQAQMGRLKKALHGARVYTTQVDHRGPRCYGIVLRQDEAAAPWSVAYSGDTKPCPALARAGAGVEVLIHEATFEDGQEEMAEYKGHSTVGQAVGIARAMGAKRLLLTHFSQRYPKLPRIGYGAERADAGSEGANAKQVKDTSMPSVGISFDMMTVSPSDIGKTERYHEALQVLFEDGEGGAGEEGDAAGEEDGAVKVSQGEQRTSSTQSNGVQAASTNSQSKENGAKDIIDGATADVKMEDTKRAKGRSHVQRTVVKDHEFVYVVAFLALVRTTQSSDSSATPNRLAFDDALRNTLEEMHGVVGASFSRDLMLFDGDGSGIRIVIKVASDHAQTLSTALAIGVVVDVAAQPTRRFVTTFAGLLSAFDLVAVHGMIDGRASMAPVGRAWMKEVASRST